MYLPDHIYQGLILLGGSRFLILRLASLIQDFHHFCGCLYGWKSCRRGKELRAWTSRVGHHRLPRWGFGYEDILWWFQIQNILLLLMPAILRICWLKNFLLTNAMHGVLNLVRTLREVKPLLIINLRVTLRLERGTRSYYFESICLEAPSQRIHLCLIIGSFYWI
jgi:hypothetical protein